MLFFVGSVINAADSPEMIIRIARTAVQGWWAQMTDWISVKDRLPKPQTEVLVFRRGIMYLAWYDNEIGS